MRGFPPLFAVGAMLLTIGCSSGGKSSGVAEIYSDNVLSIENVPDNWSIDQALQPISDGSYAASNKTWSRNKGENQKQIMRSESTTADAQGSPIRVETITASKDATLLFIDYEGDPMLVMNAIVDSLRTHGVRVQ